MQLILREDVEHLGRRGDVVKVAEGYARNYLIPKRLAYRFTEGMRRQVEHEGRARTARDKREVLEAQALAAKLREMSFVRFFRRAGESGTLFGSVTNADIAAELSKQGIAVDRRQVRLEEPIKRTGTHRINIHVHKTLSVEIPVEVEPEAEAGS